jgi:hypothetical protein
MKKIMLLAIRMSALFEFGDLGKLHSATVVLMSPHRNVIAAGTKATMDKTLATRHSRIFEPDK